jgi:hypothetical protein
VNIQATEHHHHKKWRVAETFLMSFISTCLVRWTNRFTTTGHPKICTNSIGILSTAINLLSGVRPHFLGSLALTSLKTAKMLWYPSGVWKCCWTTVNYSYVIVESISLQCGSNRMGQQPIQQEHQWVFCERCDVWGDGKSSRKIGAVFEKWWETFEWQNFQK